jgi:NAD-dependent dihydropyrimidine dehydrogenase PreA subunit
MKIDSEKCIGCLECVAYCPVEAIHEVGEKGIAQIDEDECVECSCCLRSVACPTDAIWQPELNFPRILRAEFSDPVIVKKTGVGGRGTEETKTNDVTGRYPRGFIGIAAELGRPGIGTRLSELEKVAMAIMPLGVEFEKENPTYDIFQDVTTGKLKPGISQEKVLSAILEFKTTIEKAPEVLKALQKVSQQVDTVISVDIGSRFDPDGSLPADKVARKASLRIRPNGKVNLGLGKPLVET